jgi:hypothetical protein
MREQILRHGFDLKRLFKIDDYNVGPVSFAKTIHRLEVKAHRLAEDECNGIEVKENWEDGILRSLDRITGFKKLGIPCFVNGDPRGYALKVEDSYIRENNIDIYRDWGGYGILAPEFTGEVI